MKNPKIILVLVVLLGAIGLGGFVLGRQPTSDSTPAPATMEEILPEQTETALDQPPAEDGDEIVSFSMTATESGQNAFDLLKDTHQINFQEYDFGVFVTEIEGVAGTDDFFWSLYVNNEQSPTGASQTILNAGDVATWKYEQVQPATNQ